VPRPPADAPPPIVAAPPARPAPPRQDAAVAGSPEPATRVASQAALPPSVPHPPAPPAPRARREFRFNLGGTNSETNAIVRGDAVVPVKPDARFHNMEPAYPDAAAQRGEQGTVILLIHVSPAGRPSGVDVLRSSGFRLLDRAAQQAVAGWHFLPALHEGQAVAASMPLRVVFSLR
ncbi:MAG: energy transducer TonB, partial [Acetobacteraceae bacterium]